MAISFVCILVLTACCQNCFADPGKSVENKELLSGGSLKDVLKKLGELLDEVVETVQNLLGLVDGLGLRDGLSPTGLLDGILGRASKVELSPSSIEKINQIEDVFKQLDATLDEVEAKCKEEGIYNDLKTSIDAAKSKMKAFEKEMQKISGKKPSGRGGLLGGILG